MRRPKRLRTLGKAGQSIRCRRYWSLAVHSWRGVEGGGPERRGSLPTGRGTKEDELPMVRSGCTFTQELGALEHAPTPHGFELVTRNDGDIYGQAHTVHLFNEGLCSSLVDGFRGPGVNRSWGAGGPSRKGSCCCLPSSPGGPGWVLGLELLGDILVDPVQEGGYSGIDPWPVGAGTAFAPADHACLQPGPVHAAGQWASGVTLWRERSMGWTGVHLAGAAWGTPTWQESFLTAPAHIMLSLTICTLSLVEMSM